VRGSVTLPAYTGALELPARARGRMTVTRVVRGVGELFLTVGTLLVLYVVYTVVWTNVEADQRSSRIVDDLRKQWATAAPAPVASTTPVAKPTAAATRPPAPKAPANGAGLALMVIPRLGDSWVSPVLEGVGDRSLTRGLGHYPRTALPGEIGNFSVAGHRATNGEPFARLDRVVKGDHVYVQTSAAWHDYVVDSTAIVAPTEVSVVPPCAEATRCEGPRAQDDLDDVPPAVGQHAAAHRVHDARPRRLRRRPVPRPARD
jgi:sortase A